jgi:uncharacterized membrane protein YgcG
MPRRVPVPAWLAAAAFSLAAAPESALADAPYPSIDGHMTDPQHRLKFSEKEAIEDQLGKIQTDTQVDCAGWVADYREDYKEAGQEVYDRWHIGRDWENGVFMVFPPTGPVVLISKLERPALNEAEIARVMAADAVQQPTLAKRIEHDADEVGAILRVGAKAAKPRPPGVKDPKASLRFLAVTAVIGLAAAVLTFLRRGPRRRAPAQ